MNVEKSALSHSLLIELAHTFADETDKKYILLLFSSLFQLQQILVELRSRAHEIVIVMWSY